MGHLFNVDKLHYNQNTFTGLECSNFTIFTPKNVSKAFKKVKNYKSPSGIGTGSLRSNPSPYAVR